MKRALRKKEIRTKPELGLEMIRTAVDEQVPFQWVGGEGVYGDSPTFVQGVRELKKWYVADVSSAAHVWLRQPRVGKPGPRGGRAQPKTQPISVAQAAAQLSPSAFKRITVAEGSQGSIVYEYAELKVWFSEEGDPANEPERLLVRRSLNQDGDLKYHRSNAPSKVTLRRLGEQRACRWSWFCKNSDWKKKNRSSRFRKFAPFFVTCSICVGGTKTKSSPGATGERSEIASQKNTSSPESVGRFGGEVS